MTTQSIRSFFKTALVISTLAFASCDYSEDPGPLQEIEKEYNDTDFDRVEVGDALHVDIQQGNYFQISVRGDRRNVYDLEVYKQGQTLIVKFDEWENRRHDTYVSITMPSIASANFSSATIGRISGFEDGDAFDLYLSGASTAQLDMVASDLRVTLSGASVLTARGAASTLNAEVSGASVLKGFNFPVQSADVVVTGASHGSVTVAETLHAVASGASSITYRGNPVVTSDVSGGSAIHKE